MKWTLNSPALISNILSLFFCFVTETNVFSHFIEQLFQTTPDLFPINVSSKGTGCHLPGHPVTFNFQIEVSIFLCFVIIQLSPLTCRLTYLHVHMHVNFSNNWWVFEISLDSFLLITIFLSCWVLEVRHAFFFPAQVDRCLSLRTTWSTEQVSGYPELHRKTLLFWRTKAKIIIIFLLETQLNNHKTHSLKRWNDARVQGPCLTRVHAYYWNSG